MKRDLTNGSIISLLFAFSSPMILWNLLQQVYNIADTFIAGRFLVENALAAVGGTYTLTTFLYSIIIGLCMGSGSLVSYCFGERNERRLKGCLNISFLMIGSVTLVTEPITLCFSNKILKFLHTPMKIMLLTSDCVRIILSGVGLCFYTLPQEPLLRLSFKKNLGKIAVLVKWCECRPLPQFSNLSWISAYLWYKDW